MILRLCLLLLVLNGAGLISACSDGASRPKLSHKVFLQKAQGAHPYAILPLPNGNFVIAGSSGPCWAAEVDAKGREIWTYTDSVEPVRNAMGLMGFTGACLTEKGSIFLSGNVSRLIVEPPAIPEPSCFFTYLGPTGEELQKTFIAPFEKGILHLDTATSWGKNTVAVGISDHFVPSLDPHGLPVKDERFYYIQKIDETGSTIWTKEFKVAVISAGFADSAFIGKNDSLYVVATDNLSTDILKINENGELEKQKNLPIQFHFIQPIDNKIDDIQLWGSKSDRKSILLTLDSDLEEKSELTGLPDGDFSL